MKQESLFNPQATSGADARGLTQVMPSTGAEIAATLGVDGFAVNDLYRPTISIRFGSYYLAKQLASLGQNPVFALAAYNGGAGSALRWMGNDRQIDPDLFVENIDYDETRAYVQLVMENYAYYRALYG
jgi:soluble lytic murein transglycosylase